MGRVAWTCGEGPLAPFAAGFRREMLALGHPPGSVKHYVVLMGQLDRWLAAEGIGLADLTAKHTKRFLIVDPGNRTGLAGVGKQFRQT